MFVSLLLNLDRSAGLFIGVANARAGTLDAHAVVASPGCSRLILVRVFADDAAYAHVRVILIQSGR